MLLISSTCAFLIFSLTIAVILFSRQKFIITPFEIAALNTVASNHKNVLFIYPESKPIYKAVRPLLYDFTQIGENLTATHWQKITKTSHTPLRLKNLENNLVFVPRYLGADLSPKELKDNKLVKIFDNAQIAIFERK